MRLERALIYQKKRFLTQRFPVTAQLHLHSHQKDSCDQAKESCPYFPGGIEHLHKGFSDPSEFKGKAEDVINGYRRIRDGTQNWIEKEFG